MQDILIESIKRLKRTKARRMRMTAILLVLSLAVSLDVFWALRQPGLTLAGDADCGILEHSHDDACGVAVFICGQSTEEHVHDETCCQWELTCTVPEHVHSLECYSDEHVDTETMLDWQGMFKDYPYTGNLREDLVGIAQTQVGYTESTRNFEVTEEGIRQGYTRYGAWYGTPYRDWSAMFVSFCLHYAGADPEEFPGNTGAASMAELWKKLDRYVPAGSYVPTAGDLVFLDDHRVGIVTEVQNTTCYVIAGDIEGAVGGWVMPLDDETITGWGSTEEPEEPAEAPTTEPTEATVTEPAEAYTQETGQTEPEESTPVPVKSNTLREPVVIIYEGDGYISRTWSFARMTTWDVHNIVTYLAGREGSYFFTLLDHENQMVPQDENKNYLVNAEEIYNLTVSFNSPNGFAPGTYKYQLPEGLKLGSGKGSFILSDKTDVGTWELTEDGEITMVFNQNMNNRTKITISIEMEVQFPPREEPIDFDGKITVIVLKPKEEVIPTELAKIGIQGGSADNNSGPDPSKIYWTLCVTGHKDSHIPGTVVTDKIYDGPYSQTHRYTESDMANGIQVTVCSPEGNWYNWTVPYGDPNLVWDETGWSYTMPESVTFPWGQLTLGNEGWQYYIKSTTTPLPTGAPGTYGYENEAWVDKQYAYAWVQFQFGETQGMIHKEGKFLANAKDGSILWELQAMVPGRQEGQKAEYHWYIMDYMYLLDENGARAGFVHNDANLAMVTANQNGNAVQVPNIYEATENDFFAWDNAYSPAEGGTTYGREFNLLCRCQCTADTCKLWNWERNCCDSVHSWYEGSTLHVSGFCQCWTPTDDTRFTFTYQTDAAGLVENFGGRGYQVQNVAELYYRPGRNENGAWVAGMADEVPIPGMFKKELIQAFDNYTAKYRITVNEAKLVLTDGSPLTIHDVMSDTLAYINGSLVITTEDQNGNTQTLHQDVDFTVTYDGTGNEKDENGTSVHVLDIVILRPQPVMYILNYDATLIIPPGANYAIRYNNSASINLWGTKVSDTEADSVFANINIAARTFQVEVHKTAGGSGLPLAGAKFGLFNSHGGQVATAVTGTGGRIHFETNVVEGIILQDHVLYYIQEQEAPFGYELDGTKHWICFCDSKEETCAACNGLAMKENNVTRILYEQTGIVRAENKRMEVVLPSTGGPGTTPLILASVTCIVTSLVYGFIRRRRLERRGVR